MSKRQVRTRGVSRERLLELLREAIESHPYLGEAIHKVASGDLTPSVGSGTDSGWATNTSYENQGNRWHG